MLNMQSFRDYINEASPKKLIVKAKRVSDSSWEIVNNILPDISIEMWHNHFVDIDEEGEYMPTGNASWGSKTPYDFKKFTNNHKEIDPKNDYLQLGTDIDDGYFDWFKGDNKYYVTRMSNSLEHYLKAWMDSKGISYENNFNKYYLYYAGTNTVYKSAKAKSAQWIKDVADTMIKSDPNSKGKFEVISYDEAAKYKAINLDKLR